MCSVTYESRKTCDQCVVKLVPFGQQQEIYEVGRWLQNLEVYRGMRSFFSYTKTLMEIVGLQSSNFGMDDKATGVSIPVMSSSGRKLLYV